MAKDQTHMVTLGHTEGFPTHMTRQKHCFPQCIIKTEKGEARTLGWVEGDGDHPTR
jgi:hypothetical protein